MAKPNQVNGNIGFVFLAEKFLLTNTLTILLLFFLVAIDLQYGLSLSYPITLLLISTTVLSVYILFGILRERIPNVFVSWTVKGSLLFSLSVLCLQGVVRLFPDYRYLTWHTDSRFTQSHAFSIFRYGTLAESLNFQGKEFVYHASPSQLLASTMEVFDANSFVITLVLYLLIPFLAFMQLLSFFTTLSKHFGLTWASQLLVSGLVLLIPYNKNLQLGWTKDILKTNLLDARFMTHTFAGIAIAYSVFLIALLGNLRIQLIALLLGGVAMIQTKPQYLPIMIVVYFLIDMGLAHFTDKINKPGRQIITKFAVISIILLVTFSWRSPSEHIQVIKFVPFKIERFLVFNTMPLLALGAVACVWLFCYQNCKVLPCRRTFSLVTLCLILFYLSMRAILDVVEFRVDDIAVNRLRLLDSSITRTFSDESFDQGMILIFIFVVFILAIWTIKVFKKIVWERVLLIILVALLGGHTFHYQAWASQPEIRGVSSYNAKNLVGILQGVEELGSLILVNDLTDPSDDYKRSGRGSYWSSQGTWQFFLSTWSDGHYNSMQAERRLRYVKRFFNSDISQWHYEFLVSHGISHVILNNRCMPVWAEDLVPISQNEEFTLFGVNSFSEFKPQNRGEPWQFMPQNKLAGLSSCP